MLRSARNEQVIGDRRQRMRVDDGIEIEGRGRSEGFGGVDFEGVVVRGGEEGKGVERVEGEVRYAEFVGGGGFGRFDRWVAGVAFQRVFGAFEVPEVDGGGGAA